MGFRITKVYGSTLTSAQTVSQNTTPANSYTYSLYHIIDTNEFAIGSTATGVGVRKFDNTIDTGFIPGSIVNIYEPYTLGSSSKYNFYTRTYIGTNTYKPLIISEDIGYAFDLTNKTLVQSDAATESTTNTYLWSDLWSITVSVGWTPISGLLTTDGTYGYGYINVKQDAVANYECYLVKFLLADPTSGPIKLTETAHAGVTFAGIIYNTGDNSLIASLGGYLRKYDPADLSNLAEVALVVLKYNSFAPGLTGSHFWVVDINGSNVKKLDSTTGSFGATLGTFTPSSPTQALTSSWVYYPAAYPLSTLETKKGYITFKLAVTPALTLEYDSFTELCSNTNFSVTFTASGAEAPYTFTVDGGVTVLPPELTFTDNGDGTATLEGLAPITPGDYRLKFTLDSNDGDSITYNQTFTVWESPEITNATALPDGSKNVAYSHLITYTSTGGMIFDIIAGLLPPGMTLNASTGEVGGTPTAVGLWSFKIRLRDDTGCEDTSDHTIIVTSNVVISGSLPSACLGSSYSNTLTASGGVAPYTWSILLGALPETLALNASTGEVSGTLTDTPGTYSFTVKVEDSDDPVVVGLRGYAITIYNVPTITTTQIDPAYHQTPYSFTLQQSGGDAPVSWSIVSGTLPTGLSLNGSTGEISGTPTVVEATNVRIRVTSTHGCTAEADFEVTVDDPPDITSGPPPGICLFRPFYWHAEATTANPPVTFYITDVLPEGITFDGVTGIMQGQPSQAGTFPFLLTAVDDHGLISTRGYQVVVYNSPLISTPYLPLGAINKQYDFRISLVDGTGEPPFVWMISSNDGTPPPTEGLLPPGISFDALTGTFSGIPQEYGTWGFNIEVQDANGCYASRPYFLQILGQPVIETLSLPPTCAVGTSVNSVEYNERIIASGGTPPYYFFVTSGSLPSGLILNPYTGEITGAALYPNITYTFTIQVVDQNNLSSEREFSIRVRTAIECGQDDQGPTITVVKQRLVSMESDPIVVEDPFHQKHMIEYLPVPMQGGETPNG